MTVRSIFVGLSLVIAMACGGGAGPTGPGPVTPIPDPGPVVTNTPPVIVRITAQGTRANEPASFADASEDLPVTAEVTDAESAPADLKYTWSAAVGTFVGSGRAVTWKAPADVPAPSDVALNLDVVETYTSQGRSIDNKVTSSVIVSLHDSMKEVGEMARQFLLDFSDSSIRDVAYIMRNFQPDCYGTADETGQVADNRELFRITSSRVDPPATTIQFGGICPYRFPFLRGDACAQVRVRWVSTVLKNNGDLRVGDTTVASGVDQVAAMYFRDQKRWRLCDSAFNPDANSFRALSIRGLLP